MTIPFPSGVIEKVREQLAPRGYDKLQAMGATLYIVVEGDDPGFDIFVNGRALARNEDALEKMAQRIGIKPLLEFFSADENSMALLLEEGAGDVERIERRGAVGLTREEFLHETLATLG